MFCVIFWFKQTLVLIVVSTKNNFKFCLTFNSIGLRMVHFVIVQSSRFEVFSVNSQDFIRIRWLSLVHAHPIPHWKVIINVHWTPMQFHLCKMQAPKCIPNCIWSFDKLYTVYKNDPLQSVISSRYCQVSTNVSIILQERGEGAVLGRLCRLHVKSWNVYKALLFIHLTMYVRS